MLDTLFYIICGITSAGCFVILKDRLGAAGVYLRTLALAGTAAAVLGVFGILGAFSIGNYLGGILFLWLAVGIIYRIINKIGQGAGWLAALFGFGGDDDNGHIRGAKIVSGNELNKILKSEEGDLSIAGHKVPAKLEALHFLVAGATGVGKSVAICEMLDGIAARGDRVFLADAGGNFLKAYYKPERRDLILNPLDSRAVNWSPLAEMRSIWDADLISMSIIPDGEGSNAEWNKYAQNVASAILRHCWQNKLTNKDIYRLAIIADVKELRDIFEGTPAQPLLAEGNERMFGSVRGIIGTYLSPFQFLDQDAGVETGFSLKTIVESEKATGWLFFNFRDDQLNTLKPIIAAMCDIISKTILSMEADNKRKFWLILDEFASIGRISSILDFLTKARKNGGRAVVGVQAVSQLKGVYGQADASTLLSCLSSQLVFRVPDPETADIMSRLLGEQQISRVVQSGGSSKSSSAQQFFGSKSSSENWSQQITTERAVMASELQNLETLHAYLNYAGDIPAAPVILAPKNREQIAVSFAAGEIKPIQFKQPEPVKQPQQQPEPLQAADNDNAAERDDLI